MKSFSSWIALVACLAAVSTTRALNEIPSADRIGTLAIGCQAYTFHRFTAFEAIEKTAATGAKIIELFPGQRLSTNSDAKVDHHASAEVIAQLQAKLKKHGIRAVNYGVVSLPNNEQECRAVFEFAKKLGLYAVTSEPDPAAMDLIEKLVKEYDIAMAIHNHPKQANNPKYKFWDPDYILELVKDRDPRLGSCADLGHFARSGIKPVDALKKLEGRVISSHLKDIRPLGPRGEDVPFGTGDSDMNGILTELERQHFNGNLSVEYESHPLNNVTEAAQCIGFVRGWVAAHSKE